MSIRVAMLEDNVAMGQDISDLIRKEPGFEMCGLFTSASDFFRTPAEADVVLLDFELPDASALEVLRRLKSNHSWDDAKVLIFTAFEDEARLIAAMQAGANGFLLKDIDPKLLLIEIQSVYHGGAPITPRMARALLGIVPGLASNLTPQEHRVLSMLGIGLTYADVAQKLAVSMSTVKTHIENIYRKLEVRSKSGALEKGRQIGLL